MVALGSRLYACSVIVVKYTEMLGHGGDRKSEEIKSQSCDLKTRTDVAKVAGVSEPTVHHMMNRSRYEAEALLLGSGCYHWFLLSHVRKILVHWSERYEFLCDFYLAFYTL